MWHLKCFPRERLTNSEIEDICSNMGFTTGITNDVPDDFDEHFSDDQSGEVTISVPEFDKFLALKLNRKYIVYVRLNNTTKPFVSLVRKKMSCNIATLICT